MLRTAPTLVACQQLEGYVQVARTVGLGCEQAPIIAAAERPHARLGFPPTVRWISEREWTGGDAAPASSASATRWCVTIEDPVCVAVTRMLAAATGRTAVVLDAREWADGLDRCLLDAEVTTIAFVVPLWSGAEPRLDPAWIRRILEYARARVDRLERVAWGILTGADPGALSLAAARAVFAPEIVASRAEAPAAMLISTAAERLGSSLPLMPSQPGVEQSPLQVIDDSLVRSGVALTVRERPWSLLYVRGHGRYYCGNQGFLCGARKLSEPADAPAERCVGGLSCANPHDDAYQPGLKGFPRIDPRSYDAPIMIIDSCSVGGWGSADWDAGWASLAVLAFAGSASAVISSDYATAPSDAAHLEVFAVLWSAATIGEAVARLNRLPAPEHGAFVRYLLGDPELPLSSPRWPTWCVEPSEQARERTPERQRIIARLPGGSCFARIELELGSAHMTTSHVRASEPAALRSVHLLADAHPELWIATAPSKGPLELVVDTHPTPRLPPGLFEAAVWAPLSVRSWSAEAGAGAEPLISAAARVEAVAQLIERVRGTALTSDAEELQSCVPLCRAAWLDAHLSAVRHVLTLAKGSLWPMRLWQVGHERTRTSCADPCPHCGVQPTLHRSYRSPPVLDRLQTECVGCGLLEDRPLLPRPRVSLTVPNRIAAGETVIAELGFDNRDNDHYVAIAGAVLFDRHGHDVEPTPPFAFELGPGQRHVEQLELRSRGGSAIAHRYHVRAPILINGVWWLGNRLVAVGDQIPSE